MLPQSVLADILKHLDKTKEVIDLLVRKELLEWQRRQQKACIGAPVSVCLDQMGKWYMHMSRTSVTAAGSSFVNSRLLLLIILVKEVVFDAGILGL